jgi:hypothetical protein
MTRVAVLAALLAAAPAAAEVLFEERTAAYEARAEIDDALTALPDLAQSLRAQAMAALAEFKTWSAQGPTDFGRPYTFLSADRAAFVAPGYVSVLSSVDMFTGGAHGLYGVTAATYRAPGGEALPLTALIAPEGLAAIGAALREAVAAQVHDGEIPEFWAEAVADATAPRRLDAFLIAADPDGRAAGVTFHFSPYEVGPWSEGAPEMTIPADALGEWLTPEGAALFGR